MGGPSETSSPRITRFSWGCVRVAGHEQPLKDAKLFPGGCRAWDWNETGTRHVPGIQPADVEELLEQGATVVILSRGVYERLQVCPDTLQMLATRGIPVHVVPSEQAVRIYNELRQTDKVGALLHSTC